MSVLLLLRSAAGGGLTLEIGQALENDLAQANRPSKVHPFTQATENDTAGVISPVFVHIVFVGQATETDSATAFTSPKRRAVNQASETDTAGEVDPVTPVATPIGQALEFDTARMFTITGGIPGEVAPPSGIPVLIRAPGRLGRVFHEITSRSGDTYHPAISDWTAREEAPGGFGPATGRISERVYKEHRDVFSAGSIWRTYLEADGTCIHGGRLLEPDASGGEVQLADRGWAVKAEKETERIVYQIRDIGMQAHYGPRSNKWSVQGGSMGIQGDPASLIWTREGQTLTTPDDGPEVIIPMWGAELNRLAFTVTLNGDDNTRNAFVSVFAARGFMDQDEVELDSRIEVWYGHLGLSTGVTEIDVDVDLTLHSLILPFPNSGGDNRGNPSVTGTTYNDVDAVTIRVGDDVLLTSDEERTDYQWVIVSKLRVNSAAARDNFSASDLVIDLCGRMGLRHLDIEPSGWNILPYDLPDGSRFADGLDHAALMMGWRWLIRDSGAGAFMEFGPYRTRKWTVASPWSPLDPIPMERFNRVRVPFSLSDGQSTDHVLVKADPDPLDYRNEYGRLALESPAHNRDNARNLGQSVLEQLVRPRWGGSGSFVELVGEDGVSRSAHHLFAGDTVDGRQRGEADRLLVGTLTRTEDNVQVTFDGELRALDKRLARRERKLAVRRKHRS